MDQAPVPVGAKATSRPRKIAVIHKAPQGGFAPSPDRHEALDTGIGYPYNAAIDGGAAATRCRRVDLSPDVGDADAVRQVSRGGPSGRWSLRLSTLNGVRGYPAPGGCFPCGGREPGGFLRSGDGLAGRHLRVLPSVL